MMPAGMVAWLKRILPSWLLDALVVLALAFPGACTYLKWPFVGVYVLFSGLVFKVLYEDRWCFTILRDPATRVVHGLEHATLAVLAQDGMMALHGFTHGRDRFVVALDASHRHQAGAVREAAASAIRRIRNGQRALAYQPGCSTSEIVTLVSLWLVGVTSMLLSLVLGGSFPILFAIGVIVLRFWLACETSLGLLAQRLVTVSTEFTSATVVQVRERRMVSAVVRPHGEVWFELVLDVCIAASKGGLVAPGAPLYPG